MTYQQFKTGIDYYIDTIIQDLDVMESIAEKVAMEEMEYFVKNGRRRWPTTVQQGPNDNPRHYSPSRCSIPLCMVCFAVMDFVGALIDDRENLTMDFKIDQFKRHSHLFFNKLSKRDDLNREDSLDKFQNFFRHSIMHSFLPKKGTGVGYEVDYSKFIDESSLFIHDRQGATALNVKFLVATVRNGLYTLKEIVNNEESCVDLLPRYEKIINV